MEKLEGKYFEKTIAALQQAKAAEKIEMRSAFQAELRRTLRDRALQMQEVNGNSWADWILRYKYVLGGVPVLAVLTLVMAQMVNFQVKVPSKEFTPENVEIPKEVRTIQKNSDEPTIITFSADLVMPPREVLEKRRLEFDKQKNQILEQQETSNPVNKMIVDQKIEDTSIKLKAPEIQIKSTGIIWPDAIVQPDKPERQIGVEYSSFQRLPNEDFSEVMPEEIERKEDSGRVEQSGKVEVESKEEEKDEVLVESSALMMPVQTDLTQKTSEDSLRTQEDTYIDIEKRVYQNLEKVDLGFDHALTTALPVYLMPERVYYEGEDREVIMKAVMENLSGKNGLLSQDYYVKVKILKDGSYQIVLYEYGQVQNVLILIKQNAGLKLITEIIY